MKFTLGLILLVVGVSGQEQPAADAGHLPYRDAIHAYLPRRPGKGS